MTDSRDLTKVTVVGQMAGHQSTGLGILEDKNRSGKRHWHIKKIYLSCFFSIVRHASTQLRMPAPRGMASQHLQTFERGSGQKEVIVRKGFQTIRSYCLEPFRTITSSIKDNNNQFIFQVINNEQ